MESRSIKTRNQSQAPNSRRILVSSFVGVFLLTYATGAISIGLPLYLYARGFSFGSVGLILSVSPLLLAVVYYLSAAASDIINRQQMMMVASLMQATSIGFIPFASILEQFALLQIGIGSSSAFQRSIPPAMILEQVSEKKRGSRLTLLSGIINLGNSVGISISGFIIAILGFHLMFTITSVICIFGFFAYAVSNILQSRQSHNLAPQDHLKLVAQTDQTQANLSTNKRQRFRSVFDPRGFPHNILVLFIAGIIFGAAAGIDMFAIPLFFRATLALDVTLVGLILAAGWGIYAVTVLLVSKFSDTLNPKTWYLSAAFFSVTLVFLIGLLLDTVLIVIAYLLLGIPEASRNAPRMRTIGDATQNSRLGKDSVLPSVGFALGNFMSQFGAGQLADIVGFRPLFILQGILLLIESIIFVVFIRGYQMRKPDTS